MMSSEAIAAVNLLVSVGALGYVIALERRISTLQAHIAILMKRAGLT